jgi:hypothetical protein
MATRMIVTSQPDVACDVCGRRLLRGEQPDVFLGGGRRRTVCELCAPRASAEGWLRETDEHSAGLPSARQRRGRNLLDRLRQLREPEPPDEVVLAAAVPEDPRMTSYDFFDGGLGVDEPALGFETEPDATLEEAGWPGGESNGETIVAPPVPAVPFADERAPAVDLAPADVALRSGEAKTVRALEVFNAGEHTRRVAGVARSLGAPSVSVRPLAESAGGTVVAIVVAWELCWYRYEVDLGDEVAGASVVAQGAELGELDAEDRLANAAATADGTLSLVESVPR